MGINKLLGIGILAISLLLNSCATQMKLVIEKDTIENEPIMAKGTKENLDLLKVADNRFRSGKYAEATELYIELATKSAKDKDGVVMVQALSMAARGHLISDQKTKGSAWLLRAKKLASKDEPQGWSRYIGVRGCFEWKSDDNPKATATFYEMYDYC